MSAAYRQAASAIVALFGLQLLWHGVLLPPGQAPAWLVAGLFVLPILPAVLLVIRRHRRGPFWGAVAALLYFSHGVMEAYAAPEARWLGLIEAALSVWLIVAASWNGLRARFNKTKATPPTV